MEAIVALYAEEAVFYSQAFRERQPVREYVASTFAEQSEAECRFGEPLVAGDRAAVEWWGAITARDGSVETLAGVSLLHFDAEGLVAEQRDLWTGRPGRRELPTWAVTPAR